MNKPEKLPEYDASLIAYVADGNDLPPGAEPLTVTGRALLELIDLETSSDHRWADLSNHMDDSYADAVLRWAKTGELAEKPQSCEKTKRQVQFTMKELLACSFPEPLWIITSLLPIGLTILGGKSNVRKSWMMLQLALAVVTDREFLGFPAPKGRVLYFALEDNGRRLQERAQIQAWPETDDMLIRTDFTEDELERGDVFIAIENMVRTYQPKVVILDTLSSLLEQYDQLDANRMTIAGKQLQKIGFDYACAVILVHHTKKGAPNTLDRWNDLDWYDEFRGSTAIVNSADTKWLLSTIRGEGETQARFKVSGRDFRDELDLVLDWDVERCVYENVGAAKDILHSDSDSGIISTIQSLGGLATGSQLAKELNVSRPYISKKLADLETRGFVGADANASGNQKPYHVIKSFDL